MKKYPEFGPKLKLSCDYSSIGDCQLLMHEFSLYNYRIRLLTDIPSLISYLRGHYLKVSMIPTVRRITIIFLLDRTRAEHLRKRILMEGGGTQYHNSYESTFNFDNATGLIFLDTAQEDPLGYYGIFQNVLKTLLKVEGFAFLHSSCWAGCRRSILAVGPSGFGKTTLLVSAALNGYKIVSDACAMIGQKGRYTISIAFPYIQGLSNRNNNVATNGAVLDLLDTRLWTEWCIPSILLFLEKSEGECLQWRSISRQDAIIKLLTASFKPFSLEMKNYQAVRNVMDRIVGLILQARSGILKIGQENINREFLDRGYIWQQIERMI